MIDKNKYPLTVLREAQKLSIELHHLAVKFMHLIDVEDDESFIVKLKYKNNTSFYFAVNSPNQDNTFAIRFNLYYLPHYDYTLQSGPSHNVKSTDIIEHFHKWKGLINNYATFDNSKYGFRSHYGSEFFYGSNIEDEDAEQTPHRRHFLDADYTELNQPFNELERSHTKSSIGELKANINQLQINTETLNEVNFKLDQLAAKVDDLNKFDWKSLFIGTIISLIMTFSVPPEAQGLIWGYIKSAFSGLKLKGDYI